MVRAEVANDAKDGGLANKINSRKAASESHGPAAFISRLDGFAIAVSDLDFYL